MNGAPCPLREREAALRQLLDYNRRRGNYKLALRYYLMLRHLGLDVQEPQRAYCEQALRRCTSQNLRRIEEQVRAWAIFSGHAAGLGRPAFGLDDLIRDVLSLLRSGGSLPLPGGRPSR
jgi:hypothetical protein